MRIINLFSVLFCISLSACSTYVEELASDEFAPVFPEENDTEQVSDGAIFDGNAQGLFASERKASKVGDIFTISLNESLSEIISLKGPKTTLKLVFDNILICFFFIFV